MRWTRERGGAVLSAIALACLAVGGTALPAQPVIDPGSPDGPLAFAEPDTRSATCSPNLSGIINPNGPFDGFTNALLGCVVPDAFPVPDFPTDRMQAATVSRLAVGPTLFRGIAHQTWDFSVSPSLSGRETAVPGLVSISTDIKGILAAALQGRAGAQVFLSVFDVTNDPAGVLVGTTTVFDKEVAGTFDPGVSFDLGALLPVPDGQVSVGASVSMTYKIALIDQKATATLPVLLQRGHTYRLQVEFQSRSGVAIGGGLSGSAFFGPEMMTFFELLDVRDPEDFLQGLSDLILPAEGLSSEFLTQRFTTPAFNIPGFTIGGAEATSPSVSAIVPAFSVSVGRVAAFGIGKWEGRSLGGSPKSFTIPSADLRTDSFTYAGQHFDQRDFSFELPDPVSTLSNLVDQVNLPPFDLGFQGRSILDWIDPVLRATRELSPLADIIFSPGVAVESLSVTLEEDIFELGTDLSDGLTATEQEILGALDEAEVAILSTLAGTEAELTSAVVQATAELSNLIRGRFLGLTATLEEWTALNLRAKIEDNLSGRVNDPVATFALPPGEPYFGLLDQVRQVVDETIGLMFLAGEDIFQAQRELARGDADYAGGNYKAAYEHYRKAYRMAVG